MAPMGQDMDLKTIDFQEIGQDKDPLGVATEGSEIITEGIESSMETMRMEIIDHRKLIKMCL